jgi:beta-lactamase regulating signal transducer with metallopeptidase domain
MPAAAAAPAVVVHALPDGASWSPWLQPGALVVLVALALAACGAAWLVRLWLRLRRVLGARQPETDGRLRRLLAEVARAAGLRAPPRLCRCEGLASPVAFGLWRPEVCLPLRAAQLRDDELRALLAHEVAHVRRADAFWLWLGAILQALLPWQILLWPARRRLHLVAELRCDAEASRSSSPTAVAECLLEVASWRRPQAGLPALASGMAARPSALRRRVEAVLEGPRAGRVPVAAALGLSLAMLATATAAAPGVRTARSEPGPRAEPAAASAASAAPLAAQLDGLRRERESLLAEAAALRSELRPEDPTLQRLLVLLEGQVAAMMRASDRLEAAFARLERRGPDASARRTR